MLSQIYVVSKFTNKIETIISEQIGSNMKDGDIVQTGKLIKLIKGFPVRL